MVVTTPTISITKVERDSGGGYSEITSNTTQLSNAWGDFLQITNPSGVHSEILVLHCADDGGSVTWDTDDYRITFTLNAFSQTKGSTIYSKIFDNNIIPTAEAAWSSDTITVEFSSGDLDDNPDSVQSISFVAMLDGSEWEGTTGNDIAGFIVFIIDAMPTIATSSEPTSFAFANDEFTFDSGDAGQTVSVTLTHPNLPSGIKAELFNGSDVSQTTYSTNPFTTTLTDTYYLVLYVDREYNNSETGASARRIDMVQNP